MSDESFQEAKPAPTAEEVSEDELARAYFLNRALVAESLARTYEAQADFEVGFGRHEYIPAVIGLGIATAVGTWIFRYGPNGEIWVLELGAVFVAMFWGISFWAGQIVRRQKRRMADKFRELARSLKNDASS